MRNLSDLLRRFSNSLHNDEIARQAVVQTAQDVARITLNPQNVSLKEGVLTVSLGAAAKNEFVLKEEKIKEALKGLHNIRIARVIYK